MAIVIPAPSVENLLLAIHKALDVFDLKWRDKDKIRVRIVGEYIEFRYQMNVYQHYIGRE